jgi:hypothetical protein
MTATENKEFILRYLEAVNGKPKTAAVCDLFIAEQPLKDHIAVAEAAFPLYRLDPIEIIAEDDLVCVRGNIRGVHQGLFMGIPPTGNTVEFDIYITYRIAGGKIVDHWMLTDTMTAMQQMGVIPIPG